jgi:hypothetical protein
MRRKSPMPPAPAPPASPFEKRTPLTVWLFFTLSWVLGWGLALDGVYQRVQGAYLDFDGLMAWTRLARAWGLTPLDTGWLCVVIGLGLVSASFGVYGRRPWGFTLGLLFSTLALAYGYAGTLLALLCLLLLVWPATRAHLAPAPQ